MVRVDNNIKKFIINSHEYLQDIEGYKKKKKKTDKRLKSIKVYNKVS